MTNPIQHLEQRLHEIKEQEVMCNTAENYQNLDEVMRFKAMYVSAIDIIKQSLKLK